MRLKPGLWKQQRGETQYDGAAVSQKYVYSNTNGSSKNVVRRKLLESSLIEQGRAYCDGMDTERMGGCLVV